LSRKTLDIFAPRKTLGIFDHALLRGIFDFQPGTQAENTSTFGKLTCAGRAPRTRQFFRVLYVGL
jgi:hypothetical protein